MFRSKLVNAKNVLIGAVLAAPLSAFAQTAGDPVTAAMTDASSKVGTYGAALVGVSVVGVGFALGIKFIKKISRAA